MAQIALLEVPLTELRTPPGRITWGYGKAVVAEQDVELRLTISGSELELRLPGSPTRVFEISIRDLATAAVKALDARLALEAMGGDADEGGAP